MKRHCAFCGEPTTMPPYTVMNVTRDKERVAYWLFYPPCCSRESCLEKWEPTKFEGDLSLVPKRFEPPTRPTRGWGTPMGGYTNMGEA